MYCGQCGAKNDDAAAYCGNCGARLTPAQPNPVARPKPRRSKAPVLAAVAVVVVIAIVLVVWNPFGGRSPEKVVGQFVDSVLDGDLDGVLDVLPDGMVKKAMGYEGISDSQMESLLEEGEDKLQSMLEQIDDYYGNWDYEYEILSMEDLHGSELTNIQNRYEELGYDVSAAKVADVGMTLLVDGEEEAYETTRIYLIEIGRSWYFETIYSDSVF